MTFPQGRCFSVHVDLIVVHFLLRVFVVVKRGMRCFEAFLRRDFIGRAKTRGQGIGEDSLEGSTIRPVAGIERDRTNLEIRRGKVIARSVLMTDASAGLKEVLPTFVQIGIEHVDPRTTNKKKFSKSS